MSGAKNVSLNSDSEMYLVLIDEKLGNQIKLNILLHDNKKLFRRLRFFGVIFCRSLPFLGKDPFTGTFKFAIYIIQKDKCSFVQKM